MRILWRQSSRIHFGSVLAGSYAFGKLGRYILERGHFLFPDNFELSIISIVREGEFQNIPSQEERTEFYISDRHCRICSYEFSKVVRKGRHSPGKSYSSPPHRHTPERFEVFVFWNGLEEQIHQNSIMPLPGAAIYLNSTLRTWRTSYNYFWLATVAG